MSRDPIRVLFLGHDRIGAIVRERLQGSDQMFEFSQAASADELERHAQANRCDVALIEVQAGQAAEFDLIEGLCRRGASCPLVVVSDSHSAEVAVEAMKRGAADFVTSSSEILRRLPQAIALLVRQHRTNGDPSQMLEANWDESSARYPSLAMLESVLHALPAHVALLDERGTIRLVNEAWKRFAQVNVFHGQGYGVGVNYIELCERVRDDCAGEGRRAAAGIRSVIAGEVSQFSMEYPCHSPEEKRWFRMSATPLHNPRRGAVVMHVNITEHCLAAERLRESEQLHRVTLSSLAEAVFITNDEGRFVYVCDNVRVMFGLTREEVERIGNIYALLGTRELFEPAMVHSLGRIENIEHEIRDKSGARHVVLLNVSHVDIGGGTLLFAFRDITDRKRAEMALWESEQRYRLLAEYSTDVISKHAPDGTCLYASPATLRLLGYRPEQLLGRSAYDLIHPDDRSEAQKFYDSVSNGRSRTSLYRIRRSDGEYTWFETTSRCIGLADDDNREVICMSRDVTLRKQAEDLARRQQAELAHISRLSSMGEMATGLAHELNQPLTAIAHYADACSQTIESADSFPREQLLGWTRRISEQAHQAGEIIRRIKIFGRKSEPHRGITDCGEVIQEAVELTAMDAAMHGCRTSLVLGEHLPLLDVDKVQIQQVLVNLLRNAFEALDSANAQHRTVEVRAAKEGATLVKVSVADRGAGVPEECLDEVFESFVTGKPQGTGMGLPISRSIVVNHGGRLWAVNNPEGGITFHFTLPIAPEGVTHDF